MHKGDNYPFFAKNSQGFVPTAINSKMILQCLSQHGKTPNRTTRNGLTEQIEEEITKVQKLRVTGREFYKTFQERGKSNSTRIKNMKVIVDDPQKIANLFSHKIQKRNYQGELDQLQKFNIKIPKQIIASINRKEQYQEQNTKNITSKLFSQQLPRAGEAEYYEQIILDSPSLFKKIMLAYNASKRQFQKEVNKINIRKLPLKREVTAEGKSLKRNMEQRIQPKNLLASRRNITICLYRQFQMAVNLSNRLVVLPPAQCSYKAYICKGNNGILVKSLIKSRPWWSIKPKKELDNCNLIWTEWKNNKSSNNLPDSQIQQQSSKQPHQNSQLTTNYKRRQTQILSEKKLKEMGKLLKKQDQLWQHYDKSVINDSFLVFAAKLNQQDRYQALYQKMFKEYKLRKIQKQHKIVNHLPGCLSLHSKKLLFYNLKHYYEKQGKDVFSVLPLTFHITKGSQDPQFIKFSQYYQQIAIKNRVKCKVQNIWICKPGENSNRGNGISVSNNLQEIKAMADQKCSSSRSFIIQKYFENPFLYNKRKFDIRCYILITTVNGIIKGYWYEQGYLRTSSKEFSLKNLQNKYVHLTNDAIQKKGEEYGKFQNFNKVCYSQFQKYLQLNHSDQNFNFEAAIQKMKGIATDLIHSVAAKLNPTRKQYSFQIFGLDYIFDQRLNPFLIEANSNPCIAVDGSVLGKIIPSMLQNVIRVAIDPVFPPPFSQSNKNKLPNINPFQSNKLVLVYDSFHDEVKVGSSEPLEKIQRQQNEQIVSQDDDMQQ